VNDVERARAILTEALREACLQLFAQHGVRARDDAPDDKPSLGSGVAHVAACIGFTHPSLKGSLTAYLPVAVLAKTLPISTANACPEVLHDWAGEIANQLLGRMKNTFFAYGVDWSMGMPTIIVGTDYEVVSPREARGSWHSFDCCDQLVFVHLDTMIDPKIVLRESSEDDLLGAAEGDAFLL
jgi:hypothetical protein